MFVTILDTQNYRFLAVGETAEESERVVAQGFSRHLVQMTPGATTEESVREHFFAGVQDDLEGVNVGVDAVWSAVLHDYYGLRTVELQPGQCSVDEDRLV